MRREEVLQTYYAIRDLVKQDRFYVPRNYQTIGGMWTTDRWQRDGVTYFLQDEGYSSRLFTDKFDCNEFYTYDKGTLMEFKKGDESDLAALLAVLEATT